MRALALFAAPAAATVEFTMWFGNKWPGCEDFGATTLKTLYDNFGSDITMTLNPFVYGTATDPKCFDEASPCILEQTSMCVIQVANQGSANGSGQAEYVPWLTCMDGTGHDNISKCNKEVGISDTAVNTCMSTDQPKLLKQYLTIDEPIHSTPTVEINGEKIGGMTVPSYSQVKTAICKADPSLKGCSAADPKPIPDRVTRECVKPGAVVV